jgi:hypothetical protein
MTINEEESFYIKTSLDNTKTMVKRLEENISKDPNKLEEAFLRNLRRDLINFNFTLFCYNNIIEERLNK